MQCVAVGCSVLQCGAVAAWCSEFVTQVHKIPILRFLPDFLFAYVENSHRTVLQCVIV